MNKINWNNKFLLLDALFEGGRMFVGATSMAYLLSRNLPLSAIATLKTIQSIVLILGELPTGVICDTFGRKFGLLCSLVCGLIGFYLYFLGTNLIVFGLAEILVALSLCFWSGAYEAFCIDGLVIHDDSHLINKFFHMNSSIDKVATILFGYLGGVIALKGYQFPYLAAFFAYLIAACWLLFFFKSDQVEKHEAKSIKYHFAENFRSTFKEGILNPLLMNFFIFQILIQIVIQPLLHYWQPFFLKMDPSLKSSNLGTVFFAYVVVSAGMSFIYAQISKHEWGRGKIAFYIPLFLFGVCYYLFTFSSSYQMALILFSLCQGFLSVVLTIFSSKLNQQIPSKNRAGILSSVSLFSRFGSVASLFAISTLFISDSSSFYQLSNTFKYYSLFYFILAAVCILKIQAAKKST